MIHFDKDEAYIPQMKTWAENVLAYDPFQGDFGTPADKELEDRIVSVTRKEHHCHECLQSFPAGEKDTRLMVWIFDGELCRYRICHACCDAQAKCWTDDGKAIDARYALRPHEPQGERQ